MARILDTEELEGLPFRTGYRGSTSVLNTTQSLQGVNVEFNDEIQLAERPMQYEGEAPDYERNGDSRSAEIGSAMHPSPSDPEAEEERQMIENAYKEKQITPSQRSFVAPVKCFSLSAWTENGIENYGRIFSG